MLMFIIVGCVIFYVGFDAGYLYNRWKMRRDGYSGVMIVTKEGEKTLYSLELWDLPEMLEFKKEVIFKVQESESSLRNASVE